MERGCVDNHYVKVFKGHLIELKKKLKLKNVLPPETQRQLAKEFALALHQSRKSQVFDAGSSNRCLLTLPLSDTLRSTLS